MHILMDVYIVAKVLGHMRCDWTHMRPHSSTHICTQLCKGFQIDD